MSARLRSLLLGAALALAAAGAAAGEELEVVVTRPEPSDVVFGLVEAAVEVYPYDAEVDRVEFFLDDQFIEARRQRPFTFTVDVGNENRSHDFLFVVYEPEGASTTVDVTTAAIRSDLQVDVDLQQLFVVAEVDGVTALDLKRDEFTVSDSGDRQELVTFERGDIPFSAVLLLDASSSMRGEPLRTALRAAEAFVDGMQSLDEAKVILFSDRVVHETPFSSLNQVLSVGLDGVEAAGGTALNDAIFLSLLRLGARQGRKVVIVLSDGIDPHSTLGMAQVREAVRNDPAVLYWVRLVEGPDPDAQQHISVWRTPQQHRDELALLRETVIESGGRILEIEGVGGVPAAFATILEELRAIYVLGYYPQKRGSGRWRKVAVRVARPGVRIRTQSGYLDRQR